MEGHWLCVLIPQASAASNAPRAAHACSGWSRRLGQERTKRMVCFVGAKERKFPWAPPYWPGAAVWATEPPKGLTGSSHGSTAKCHCGLS